MMNRDDLYKGIREGNRFALARAISVVENKRPDYETLMSKMFKHTGKAHIIGITGPPGAGKSTLVDKITKAFRGRNKTIGIIAVDPTSPYTGGAILGDRIRMTELATDKEVFIRSMGTRGHLGGLAQATSDVIKLMDAFGKDIILVETVGAGQSEVDIVENAHTTIIVEMPGLGDDVQAIKAGIFEIADIFVVNKCDREGSDKTIRELKLMLEMGLKSSDKWEIPVLKSNALDSIGVDEIVDTLEQHYTYLKEHKLLTKLRFKSLKHDFEEILKERLYQLSFDELKKESKDILTSLKSGKLDPYSAADKIASRVIKK
jgi:LAO/AO transport system kinase